MASQSEVTGIGVGGGVGAVVGGDGGGVGAATGGEGAAVH